MRCVLAILFLFGCSSHPGNKMRSSKPSYGWLKEVPSQTSDLTSGQLKMFTDASMFMYAPQKASHDSQKLWNGTKQGGDCQVRTIVFGKKSEIEFEIDMHASDCLLGESFDKAQKDYRMYRRISFLCIDIDFSEVNGKNLRDVHEIVSRLLSYCSREEPFEIGYRSVSETRYFIESKENDSSLIEFHIKEDQSDDGDFCYLEGVGEAREHSYCENRTWISRFRGQKINYYGNTESQEKPLRLYSVFRLYGLSHRLDDLFFRHGTAEIHLNDWQGSFSYASPQSPPLLRWNRGRDEIEYSMALERPLELRSSEYRVKESDAFDENVSEQIQKLKSAAFRL